VVEMETIDVGGWLHCWVSGLIPTIQCYKTGKQIALANKETLVVAGEIITAFSQSEWSKYLPVGLRAFAIFPMVDWWISQSIEKIILTDPEDLSAGKIESSWKIKVKPKPQALKHPNWEMGAKITIRFQGLLMNKGLEVNLKAKWLSLGWGLSQITS